MTLANRPGVLAASFSASSNHAVSFFPFRGGTDMVPAFQIAGFSENRPRRSFHRTEFFHPVDECSNAAHLQFFFQTKEIFHQLAMNIGKGRQTGEQRGNLGFISFAIAQLIGVGSISKFTIRE